MNDTWAFSDIEMFLFSKYNILFKQLVMCFFISPHENESMRQTKRQTNMKDMVSLQLQSPLTDS